MPSSLSRVLAIALSLALALANPLSADPVIPGNILNPKSAAEAWNVIRLATKNIEQLLEENRLPEIPVQISYCGPALRALPLLTADPGGSKPVQTQIMRAFVSVNAIIVAAKENNPVGAKSALASLRTILEEAAKTFDPKVVGAEIFVCPMHSDILSDNAATPCAKCGMSLLTRRIPYSFIYTKPGAPSVHLAATPSGPMVAGKKVEVVIRMTKADQSPVVHADLIEMHTQPIHLLIEEPGLGDYHHEHPLPTQTPGEYVFSFTPAKTAPYRIWADLVPVATGVQELPFVDLPSAGKAAPIEDTANRFTAAAGGYQFTLAFPSGNELPTKAGQARTLRVKVTDSAGQSVTTLQPVMNAFSHLVGFYDDYQTVVHLHPGGGEVLDPELRGGPALDFILFPPRAGFIRLYCQVSIAGQMLFAPFNLNVEP